MTASYLVTGCSGFIGAKVTEQLLAGGHSVTGVDNHNDAYDQSLKRWRLRRLRDEPQFTFRQLDICDRESLGPLFETKFDAVINLAARAGVRQSVANPRAYFDTNVTGNLNLLEMCREFAVKKFVLASTSSLYGADNRQPFREDANTDAPLSPYAASKKAAETLSYTYNHIYDIDVSVLRFFTVYGPAGRPDMSLFRFVQWIAEDRPVIVYGDGSQSRDFTYVDDIARGTVAALKPVGYEVVNLGGNRPVVLMDALRLMEHALGRRANIVHVPSDTTDVVATWADISKAKRLLKWQPEIPIEEGIQRLADWYQQNRKWAKAIQTG